MQLDPELTLTLLLLQTEPVLEEWPEATTTQTEEEFIVPIYEPPPKQCAEIATQVEDAELRPHLDMQTSAIPQHLSPEVCSASLHCAVKVVLMTQQGTEHTTQLKGCRAASLTWTCKRL